MLYNDSVPLYFQISLWHLPCANTAFSPDMKFREPRSICLTQGLNQQQLHCSLSKAKPELSFRELHRPILLVSHQLLPQPSPLSSQWLFRYQLPCNGALTKSFTVIQSFLRHVSAKEMASQSTHTKPMPAIHRPQTKLSVSGQLLNLATWGTGAGTSPGDVPTGVSQL